ncbi:metallophosphoesterase [Pseudomonas entomophila]|uniref:metallophosphoesterase n=1 Tax=Pseudomonas entomophila TaxID=312306 RepID=UPI0023D7C0C3|nr:metallophosphoesterase [Pseudomonas entomophila]MDF0730018.1 metallophosphoesterase [Pseudomonas entomophila]
MSKKFTWLHLSDLHVGQNNQSWLWPNFKSVFLEDLEALLQETGSIDAVIFSGDLTQRGSTQEFNELTTILEEIWEVLLAAGSQPILFTVPGNHDLSRPDESPAGEVLKEWWDKSKVREAFWKKDTHYYPHVCGAFDNYIAWQQSLDNHPTINIGPHTTGFIPGDKSATIELNGIKVGLVGLNSAFLQLTGDDYEGKLDLNVKQVLAITNDSPQEWCLQHDINFLITHHPSAWLKDVAHFEEHIYHPNRFTAHLFGHVHDPDNVTISRAGMVRKQVPAASLFGLAYVDDSETLSRAHGYSIGVIELDDAGGSWKLWPRKSHVGKDNSRKFIPDYDLPLQKGKEFLTERLSIRDKAVESKTVTTSPGVLPNLASPSAERIIPVLQILESTIHRIITPPSHTAIRGLEQQTCCFELESKRISWVVSDWGLGTDCFLSSVLDRLGKNNLPLFKVDLGSYSSREEFFSDFSSRTGCSFTEYCKALASNGASILILDEAPVVADNSGLVSDAMKLAELVTDFCTEVSVFIVSRSTPKLLVGTCIRLAPLDEPDTRAYLVAHPDVGHELLTKSAVSDIYRHTEGVPGKIDRAIKQLRVVSLSDLTSEMITDIQNSGLSTETIPHSLTQAVDKLRHSKDDHSKRTWALLKLLSTFPSGEVLQRIKYLIPRCTLRSEHAEELLELNLIGVRVASALMTRNRSNKENFKILYTPRQVRDHVISLVPSPELENLTARAITLYFGENWRAGTARLRAYLDDPKSDDASIMTNAGVLTLRLLATATASRNKHSIRQAILVCRSFCQYGYSHKHYRDVVSVCKEILMILPPEVDKEEKGYFELTLANSLRMTGDGSEAVQIYERLQHLNWSNNDKMSVLLNHAFCLEDSDPDEALVMAREILRIGKHSHHALQAQTLILEIEAAENLHSKLAKIERDARKKGANVAANNIVLSLASSAPDSAKLEASLVEVRETAEEEQDFYNSARAAIHLARIYTNRGESLPAEILANLIKAYQYLFGQRISGLFDSAHSLLWDEFESNHDIPNLLTLFKHSSFNWRLDNKEQKEKRYASRLIALERKLLKVNILRSNADTAYFLSRSGKQLLLK